MYPIRLCVILLLACACSKSGSAPTGGNTPSSKTYYVSPTGSDAAAGTINAPLRGINTALDKAVAGDTVMVKTGVYHEKVRFPKSGRLDKYITLKAYPGDKPVIDGTGLGVTGKEALVNISKSSYIIFEGFDVCNFKSSSPWVSPNGIVADAGASNLVIRKNKIYNIEHNAAPADGRSAHAIEIFGNTSTPMKNILVEDNEIHDCNTGYSENLTVNGYVDGFTIRGNKIYNAENIGIDAAGGYAANTVPEFNYARNGVITGNELFNIDMTTGPVGPIHGHGAIGIYVDGARNITVEKNKIYDTDRGIGIVSENDAFPTSNCIVRNNVVYNCWRTGIYLGGYLGYTSGGTRDCYVVNNTVFFNNRENGAFGENEGEIRLTEQCFNNIIRNNIVYARPGGIFVHKYSNTGSGNIINNNMYFTTGTPQWIWNSTNGAPYTTLAAWQNASGTDEASVSHLDPLFVNLQLPDLQLQSASPAKTGGVFISADVNGTTDILGKPRFNGTNIGLGAYQAQ